ncbi:hypothetical protein Pyn_18891 [Prunus yedoensis var. nudiflora]|uniref:Uncharacterized protein n=1 Tax=Prunus yedoensis var. nudiflora TaxID=2094558 RepID=A0A314YXJ3_PRUYE|nr:hypothetical protein Pyn_18891 [Prunus yedoensis var. nudiflora]
MTTTEQGEVSTADQGEVEVDDGVREVVTVAVPGSGGEVEGHADSEEIEDGWSADEHPSTMTQ